MHVARSDFVRDAQAKRRMRAALERRDAATRDLCDCVVEARKA
jgi:hypothetical protein